MVHGGIAAGLVIAITDIFSEFYELPLSVYLVDAFFFFLDVSSDL